MSEFDKEAEREKLRKKYEEDEADREMTQRMSELLLQGATMTNQHCDNCGSPIFRYEGQSFCPTCQAEGEPQAAAGQQPGEDAQPDETPQNQAQSGEGGRETDTGHQGDADDARTAPAQRPTATERAGDAPNANPGSAANPAPPSGQSGDLSDARDALVRKLTQLAQEAERTTDVNRTRDLLAASKEAAEALAALDRVSRNDR